MRKKESWQERVGNYENKKHKGLQKRGLSKIQPPHDDKRYPFSLLEQEDPYAPTTVTSPVGSPGTISLLSVGLFLLTLASVFNSVEAAKATRRSSKELSVLPNIPFMCTAMGVCYPTPQIKQQVLPAELLASKISVSKYALQDYKKMSRTAEQDKQYVIEVLQNISKTNRRIYCKLRTLFEHSPNFSIRITTHKDPDLKTPGAIATFARRINTILIFTNQILNPSFSDIIIHEAHHGFVYYGNSKNPNKFFETDNKVWSVLSVPCTANKDGTSDCREIAELVNQGTRKVGPLMDFIDHPETLDSKQVLAYKKYLDLSKDYKPVIVDQIIPPSTIDRLKKQKLLDKRLKILDPGYLLLPYHDNNLKAYVTNIRYINGEYIGTAQTCLELNNPRAPCLDMLFLFSQYGNLDSSNLLKERDAVIHQLFSKHPELMDFLFPGLEEAHFKRTGKETELCLRQ